ncbi:Signal-induced proliferation-associated 1-like protein 1 [Dissostichus eleginoides]|uniref:Signal-induced proliferation-associated 1-like protein 1 n=1 Tax=Dissostichus eleginoides TaxID=100907 RepID=A0AAD9BU98_DISEL|nr:Signal-induced proliferation-associated 1-like protein 1 [Dissostichus eleginoides]
MTSLKRSQTERSVGGSVPASDEFYTRRLRLPNGGAPPPRSESAHISSSSTTGTNPAVPKMGVRARVADWPPRKDGGGGGVWHITVETDSPSSTNTTSSSGSGSGDRERLLGGGGGGGESGGGGGGGRGSSGSGSGSGGSGSGERGGSAVTAHSHLSAKLGHLISPQDSSMLRNIHNTLKNKMHSKGKDNRFLSPDGYLGSPRKGMRRIRQRSNSDITISELDVDGNEGWSFSGWTPMHREYGSTSSIDKHGVSGESFFDMLKGYQSFEAPDQRSPAPEKLSELLTVAPTKQAVLDLPDGALGSARGSPASRLKEREKHLKRRSKSETGGESIFRKLRSVKVEGDSSRAGSDAEDGGKADESSPPPKPWACQKGFAHFDIQSLLFDLNEAIHSRQSGSKRKNTTTGASAAAAASASATSSLSSNQSGIYGSPCGSQEELSKEGTGGHGTNPALDPGDDKTNDLVLSCPCFRNEIGGEGERNISSAKQPGSIGSGETSSSSSGSTEEGPLDATLTTHFTNAGVAVLEAGKDGPGQHADRSKRYIVEHVDLGTYYYRKFFYLREHWNYLGVDENLGPVAVSLRREKLDEHKDHGQQYNYRVIFRMSELNTLRGSILEDAVPSTSKHGLGRGLPLKEVLEYLVPELNVHCLRLALNTPKVTEQLMKLDEQGLSFQRKVGLMYCMAGQSSEEEMYNNESAGPALEEFLHLLGERVRLKGFSKYRAQLDAKTDSTGTHSMYTTYKDYEIMFHVSTMLPYTPNNKQQLLRKRHIGNDIVTIVFQEPGALPFTPKNIRSHFQHVFVVVRAHNPCSENSSYSVAVTRSKDVPSFGPPIPEDVTFPKSSVFRDFLLAKVINAENAAHKSQKFRAMATRTRQEYLRDLAERHTTSTPIDPSGKFPFISLAHKKKEKSRPYGGAELRSLGAVTWLVQVEDHGTGGELEALLAVSNDFLILLDQGAKAVVFNCAAKDVIGWTASSPASLRIFYERGESVSLRSISNNTEDFKEVVKRLEFLTKGCETSEMTLRRNGLGQLGFHVNYEGIVAEVEPYGYAWQAGLRQGSRLVEICKVAVATLTHEQMIDVLRTSVAVRVVIIPPHDDATPRRGCSELYRMPASDYKSSSGESGSFEYKFPFRNNNNKWQRTSSSPQQSLTASPQPHTPNRAISLGSSGGKTLSAERLERGGVIPRSVSSDGRPLDTKRMSPGCESYSLASSMALGRSPHNRSSPSNLSCSSDASGSSAHWRQKSMPEQFAGSRHSPMSGDRRDVVGEGGSSGKSTPNWSRMEEGGGAERTSTESPVSKSGQGYSGAPRIQRQEQVIHVSPKKGSQSDGPYSGHSSSNTLSSTASSGGHSDSDKWYEMGAGGGTSTEPAGEPEPNGLGGGGYLQGAPTEGGRRMLERSPAAAESPGPPGERSLEGTGRSPPTHLLVRDSSTFSLNEAGSHSSSRHSGHSSPRDESSSSTTSPSSQSSSSSPGPKSFYPRQGAQSKYLIGWRKPGSTINSVDFGDTRKKSPGEGGVEVVPVPAARPSLRDMHSPQPHAKSTMEEDIKRHNSPDSPPPPRRHKEKHGQKPQQIPPLNRHRPLHRTLSDESIYRGQRLPPLLDSMPEPALGADLLFSCSTLPRSPTTRGVPLRRPSYKLGVKLHGDLSASDTSLVDLVERHRGPLPQELMPLPSQGQERESPLSGLTWWTWPARLRLKETHTTSREVMCLEIQTTRAAGPRAPSSPTSSCSRPLCPGPRPGHIGLERKVTKLEATVKMLQEDLKKEREEKLRLQGQVKRLWEDNQRLLEESQTSATKLKKFTEWVFNTIDMN